MFNRLKPEQRGAAFLLVALHVPAEVSDADLESWNKLWSYRLLEKLANELHLSTSMITAHMPMLVSGLPYREMDWNQRTELSTPYIALLNEAGVQADEFYATLLIFFIEREMMDGRGIALMRNLTRTMVIARRDAVWLQHLLVNYLITKQQEIAHVQEKKDNRYRYAKIGAVAVGAGALIAFTAGLVHTISPASALSAKIEV